MELITKHGTTTEGAEEDLGMKYGVTLGEVITSLAQTRKLGMETVVTNTNLKMKIRRMSNYRRLSSSLCTVRMIFLIPCLAIRLIINLIMVEGPGYLSRGRLTPRCVDEQI